MSLCAVIVAAGSSTRAGFDKVFAQLGGRAVLQHSVEAFERAVCVEEIIVVCRAEAIDAARSATAGMKKVRAVIPGGERRQDSVEAGLDTTEMEYVAVHDAARPLITAREIERVYAEAQIHDAAVLAMPVTDTLKTANAEQFVSGSIDRANVFAMQTPQIFERDVLREAFRDVASKSLHITDEVSAMQLIGAKIAIVPAREQNMKITFASDLPLAEFILQHRSG